MLCVRSLRRCMGKGLLSRCEGSGGIFVYIEFD